MMNYFTFGNLVSSDYGVYVAKSNMFDSASEDVEEVIIPGRNGALHISNNRFNVFEPELVCYVTSSNIQESISNFRNALQSIKTIAEYRESLVSGQFRKARYIDGIKITGSDTVGAYFTLKFRAQPERYLDSGQTTITLTASGTISNPGLDAKPLIAITGNGTVVVNGYSIVVTNNASNTLYIDCESMQIYRGTTNKSSYVTMAEFPVLSQGSNTVTLTSVSRVVITPRWWIL